MGQLTSLLRIPALATLLLASPFAGPMTGFSQELSRHDAGVMAAARADDLETLKQLAEAGTDLTKVVHQGVNLATIAALRGMPETLEFLAAQGVDLDLRDPEGYSPVMRALQQARVDNALKLRELGASLEGVTEDGYSVRVLAEVVGLENFGPEPPLPSLLLSPEAADTILLKAAEFGDLDSVRFALEHGANVSARAANGWTPLMIAALGGHARVVSLLANSGALGEGNRALPNVDGKVDAIIAALVGGAKREEADVEAIVCAISEKKDLRGDHLRYLAVGERLGYRQAFLERHFGASDLPPLEIDLPFPRKGEPDDWRTLQTALQNKGLYDGAIDGVPGEQSLTALYGYFRPLLENLTQRSATAAARGLNSAGDTASGYGHVRTGRRGSVYGQTSEGERQARYSAEGIGSDGRPEQDLIVTYYTGEVDGQIHLLQLGLDRSDGGRYDFLSVKIAGGIFFAHMRDDYVSLSFTGEYPRKDLSMMLNQGAGSHIEIRPIPAASLTPRREHPCLSVDLGPIILDSASSTVILDASDDAPAEPRSRLLRIDEDPPATQEPDAGSTVQDASEAWER